MNNFVLNYVLCFFPLWCKYFRISMLTYLLKLQQVPLFPLFRHLSNSLIWSLTFLIRQYSSYSVLCYTVYTVYYAIQWIQWNMLFSLYSVLGYTVSTVYYAIQCIQCIMLYSVYSVLGYTLYYATQSSYLKCVMYTIGAFPNFLLPQKCMMSTGKAWLTDYGYSSKSCDQTI